MKSRYLVAGIAGFIALVGIAGAVVSQTIQIPKVASVQSSDLFQDIVNGTPQAQSYYATPAQIAAFVRGSGGSPGSWPGNVLQNSDFQVDKQNAGAAVTLTSSNSVSYRAPDRWLSQFYVSGGSAGNPTAQQVAIGSGFTGSAKELKITSNATAASTPAGSYGVTGQYTEGGDIADLNYGTASAGQLTYTVPLKASVAGTYFVALQNSANNRSYVHGCVVATAAVVTNCQFTVTGDLTGTWLNTPGTIGLRTYITWACGTTYQAAAADTWSAGAFYCTAAQLQLTVNVSATLEIGPVKVERGNVATAYAPDPVATSIPKLDRYYRTTFALGTAPAQSATLVGALCGRTAVTTAATFSVYWAFNQPMYAAPTVTTFNPAAANANWRDVTGSGDVVVQVDVSSAKGTSGVEIGSQTTALTAAHDLCIGATADTGL